MYFFLGAIRQWSTTHYKLIFKHNQTTNDETILQMNRYEFIIYSRKNI